jgi:hypothetical protein
VMEGVVVDDPAVGDAPVAAGQPGEGSFDHGPQGAVGVLELIVLRAPSLSGWCETPRGCGGWLLRGRGMDDHDGRITSHSDRGAGVGSGC